MSVTMAALQTTVDEQARRIEALEKASAKEEAAQGKGDGASSSQAVLDLGADFKLLREQLLGLESDKAGSEALAELVSLVTLTLRLTLPLV